MQVFEHDIAVDMGTSSTLLFEAGKGIVAREPTVVAVDKYNGKIVRIGQEAQKMLAERRQTLCRLSLSPPASSLTMT